MKWLEARFIGKGTTWVDNRWRGWEIQCSKCPNKKIICSHGKDSLPPPVIVKKLKREGWQIGKNPKEDVCQACQRKDRQVSAAKLEAAKKALKDAALPMVEANGHRVHMSEVLSAAKQMDASEAKALIKVLQEKVSTDMPTKKREKAIPAPLESTSDYERWLREND